MNVLKIVRLREHLAGLFDNLSFISFIHFHTLSPTHTHIKSHTDLLEIAGLRENAAGLPAVVG